MIEFSLRHDLVGVIPAQKFTSQQTHQGRHGSGRTVLPPSVEQQDVTGPATLDHQIVDGLYVGDTDPCADLFRLVGAPVDGPFPPHPDGDGRHGATHDHFHHDALAFGSENAFK
jgi:hypothetical protein